MNTGVSYECAAKRSTNSIRRLASLRGAPRYRMNLRWHNPAKAAATRPSSSAPISSEVGRCGAGGCGASGKGGGEVLVVFEREGPCLSALVRVIRRRRQRRGYVLLYGGLPSGCVQEGSPP